MIRNRRYIIVEVCGFMKPIIIVELDDVIFSVEFSDVIVDDLQ